MKLQMNIRILAFAFGVALSTFEVAMVTLLTNTAWVPAVSTGDSGMIIQPALTGTAGLLDLLNAPTGCEQTLWSI